LSFFFLLPIVQSACFILRIFSELIQQEVILLKGFNRGVLISIFLIWLPARSCFVALNVNQNLARLGSTMNVLGEDSINFPMLCRCRKCGYKALCVEGYFRKVMLDPRQGFSHRLTGFRKQRPAETVIPALLQAE
jgi:hypothetical protein